MQCKLKISSRQWNKLNANSSNHTKHKSIYATETCLPFSVFDGDFKRLHAPFMADLTIACHQMFSAIYKNISITIA